MATSLPRLLATTYRLLRRTSPTADDYDVAWHGPHFIPRSGQWHPTRFLLYDGKLFATVELEIEHHQLTWTVGTKDARCERGLSSLSGGDELLWHRVLSQVIPRLRAAIADPERYNRRVERLLPFACRTGKIQRHLTWPPNARTLISAAGAARLERGLAVSAASPPLPTLTLGRYLKTAGIALDAAFPDVRDLPPLQKYRRRADTRHGGLLNLPRRDAGAFARWFRSRAWAGCHPWEIVFGHPHGILLSPLDEKEGWRFSLGVDTLGLYVAARKMAEALLERGIPLQFWQSREVIAALRGTDLVEVGPGFGQRALEELEERRPGARKLVQWDPVPRIALATAADRLRIRQRERGDDGAGDDGSGEEEPGEEKPRAEGHGEEEHGEHGTDASG